MPQPAIDRLNGGGRPAERHGETRIDVFVIIAHRKDRGEHRADLVRVRQLGDHRQIVLDSADGNTAGDVIGAGQYQHGSGLERDHVRHHAAQHLTGNLAADAAIDEVAAGEIFRQPPAIRDGVAEEHDARRLGRGRPETCIFFGVTLQVVAIRVARLLVFVIQQRLKVGIHAIHGVAQLGNLLARGVGKWILLGQGVGKCEVSAHVGQHVVHLAGVLGRAGFDISQGLPYVFG